MEVSKFPMLFNSDLAQLFDSILQFLTSLASNNHGLHDEGEEFIHHQVEEKNQRL